MDVINGFIVVEQVVQKLKEMLLKNPKLDKYEKKSQHNALCSCCNSLVSGLTSFVIL